MLKEEEKAEMLLNFTLVCIIESLDDLLVVKETIMMQKKTVLRLILLHTEYVRIFIRDGRSFALEGLEKLS